MRLLVVLTAGIAVALAVAAATGSMPDLRPRRRREGPSAAQQWLIQAGLPLTPAQFWAATAALATATFLLLSAVTGAPAVAVVPAVAVGVAPRVWWAAQRDRRLAAIGRAWPEGLRELSASLSAGLSVHQALVALAETGPEPLRDAFARYEIHARLHGVAAALGAVAAEVADPTTDRVVEVLTLAHRHGGALVTRVLDELADHVARDAHTTEEIHTLALESKINARAVFALPWITLAALCARPGPFRAFYTTPTVRPDSWR